MKNPVFFFPLLLLFSTINAQHVGIGTTVPKARLDVWGTGTTSSTTTFTLRNSLGDTLLKMKDDGKMGIGYNGISFGRAVNIGGSGINFYTANEAGFGGAIFPTDTSLVMWSNSGPNNYLIFQPSMAILGLAIIPPMQNFILLKVQC